MDFIKARLTDWASWAGGYGRGSGYSTPHARLIAHGTRLRAIQATLPLRLYHVQTPTQQRIAAHRAYEAQRKAGALKLQHGYTQATTP